MEIGREMIDKIFEDTEIPVQVGGKLMSNEETILNYLVLAPSVENDSQTIRWDGSVRVSPRMTIAADEYASVNLGDFYSDEEKAPPWLEGVSIVFRSAYLHLDREIERQHIPNSLDETVAFIRNIFDRITSHRSRSLSQENNALIIAPSEFVWPVSVIKYVSQVVGRDFRSFRRYGP